MEGILFNHFIIDGIPAELTPADMLRECSLPGVVPEGSGEGAMVADESMDPRPGTLSSEQIPLEDLTEKVVSPGKRILPLPFSASFTAGRIAGALLDAIWMGGHFRLGDLTLRGEWRWNMKEIGLPAAFYASVEKAGEYMDALGLKFSSLHVSTGTPTVHFKAVTTPEGAPEQGNDDEEDELFRELPFRTAHPRISSKRKCPVSILPERSDWLVYIPFDTCDYRLGGSALSQGAALTDTTAPDIDDADYFIDCYEVVRELVEDGIVRAGATVGDGGLMTALRTMARSCGADISVGDVCRFYGEDALRVLFAEVPGVILQIADLDYDYLDAELILQDVAYFPLGHPDPEATGLTVLSSETSPIHGILDSLLQTLEGED